MNEFSKYISGLVQEEEVASSTSDIATVDAKPKKKCKKKTIKEESEDKEEYQKYFNKILSKYGVESPAELSDEDKKKFYDEVDAGWEGVNEEYDYEYEDEYEDEDDYDIDGNGRIDIRDLIYLCEDLSESALIEVIDLVSEYLEEKYEYDDDGLPSDSFYQVESLQEAIIRKKVVRNGKKKIIKKSSKPGYKMVGGKEVKMTPKEIRTRIKSAKIASRKRKSKKSSMSRKRKISMSRR